MPEIIEIDIDELQPIDLDVSQTSLDYYASTFPLLEEHQIPEVWELDGVKYLSDGHKQLYNRRNNLGKRKALVLCHTENNCNVSSQAYGYVTSSVLERAEIAMKNKIRHINDLKITA